MSASVQTRVLHVLCERSLRVKDRMTWDIINGVQWACIGLELNSIANRDQINVLNVLVKQATQRHEALKDHSQRIVHESHYC